MHRCLPLVLALLLLPIMPAAAQQNTWWAVLESNVAIEGRPVMLLIGPFPSLSQCRAQLPDLRRSQSTEDLFITSASCRSAVDVARMMLAP